MTTATAKPNKFVSFFEAIGKDFKKGLDKVLPIAETAGSVAMGLFAPALGPLYNQTVAAIVTAEQSAAAIPGGSSGTQKLAAVVNLMGPLIAQGLTDVGKPADDAAVEKYISAVVTILNAVPNPAATTTTLVGGVTAQPAV